MSNGNLVITILYDNDRAGKGLRTGWGFSVLIEFEDQQIIFDSGADKQVLAHNMDQLGVQPAETDQLILSHYHCDHLGGISALLGEMKGGTVYVPEGFPTHLIRNITDHEVTLVTVGKPVDIGERGYSTGNQTVQYRGTELGEHGLVLESGSGPVLITGCAHPGIDNVVNQSRKVIDDNFQLVLGGFHLFDKSSEEIGSLGKRLSGQIETICPCHCTGKKGKRIYKGIWGDDYIEGGVGKRIDLQA